MGDFLENLVYFIMGSEEQCSLFGLLQLSVYKETQRVEKNRLESPHNAIEKNGQSWVNGKFHFAQVKDEVFMN